MGEAFNVHPLNPQPRALHRACEVLRAGGLLLLPTDAGYCLAWGLNAHPAEERVKRLRLLDSRHPFTLLCASLSEAGRMSRLDDAAFRLMRSSTPGPGTFILPAAAGLPKRLKLAKRKTVGVRIPAHAVVQALLEEWREPLLASSAVLPGEDDIASHEAAEVSDALLRHVDLMLDAGDCPPGPTSIVDCTGAAPVVLRQGYRPIVP